MDQTDPSRERIAGMTAQDPVELDSLVDAYDVVAELRTHEDGRTFIAKRRNDGADVLILVVRTPNGDEKNGLTLFAADTQLLSTHTHRNLVPIIEGRWVGTDAFAVVSERVIAPTLEELLARGEEFSSSRVAAILRDVDAVLEWARGQKVVHRGVSAGSVFVEPGTDRVLIAFVIRPIPVFGAPDADVDARTIARLAWMMLARTAHLPEGVPQPLSELRPDLPERVVAETEMLLHSTLEGGESVPDVRSYVARIAMADALKVGEEETTRVHKALLEEQRAAREQWDAERAELERAIAKEREELAALRAELERSIASERDQLAVERQELEQIGAAGVVDDGRGAVTLVDANAGTKRSNRARWAIGGAAAALIAIVATALAIGNRGGHAVASSGRSGLSTALAPVVIDSAAGGIPGSAAPPPPPPRSGNASPAVATRQATIDSAAPAPVSPRRIGAPRKPAAKADSLVRRDSTVKPKPDTLARPDTTAA